MKSAQVVNTLPPVAGCGQPADPALSARPRRRRRVVRFGMVRWREAEVTQGKILDYLLAADHPVGGDKAAFFMAIGYTRAHWGRLRDDLLRLARDGDVAAELQTPFGIKYVVDGVIDAPARRSVGLRTIWISDGADEPPRLVTAYPR